MPEESRGNARYSVVSVSDVGFADQQGLEGVVVLSADDGRKFPVRAFSGEVARHIARFRAGDRSSIPTVYNMVEELADHQALFLHEVEIYQRDGVLRANLYFVGRTSHFVLHNYRASDSIALATFYDVPMKIRRELIDELRQE